MAASAWPWSILVLAAPLVLGLAAAYPHRAYHDEVDVQTPEKSVRHIDGLGVSEAQRQLEESVRRQVDEQVRATGRGSASGQWSVRKYAEYSGGEGGGVPVRASITGEALDDGSGVVTANCHNCRMKIRRVGGGSMGHYGSASSSGQQQESSQSRYHSSSSGGVREGGVREGGVREGGYAGGPRSPSSSDLVVHSSRYEQESSGFGLRPESSRTTDSSRVTTSESQWNLQDLGYATQDLQELIRRMDEDLRAGRYRDGKTVTTVTTTTSENGGPPVTRKETLVKDGAQVGSLLPGREGLGHGLGAGLDRTVIGHSEVEDLLKTLREELRSGKTQAGKTVTTVVESSSVNGAQPVVTKKTFVRDGLDTSALALDRLGTALDDEQAFGQQGSRSVSKTTTSVWTSGLAGLPLQPQAPQAGLPRAPGPVDHLGGGHLLTPSHHTSSRNYSAVSSYSGGTGQDAVGGQQLQSGGYRLGSSHGSDLTSSSLSRGSLYGAEASAARQESMRADALGAQSSLSVSQMPGYRREVPVDNDGDVPMYGGSNSKYYSTFSSYNGGAPTGLPDGGYQQPAPGSESALLTDGGASRTSSSSSSYKKVVTYSSSGSADVLGGDAEHVAPSRPSSASSSSYADVQRTVDAVGQHGEQGYGAGRIPEAASGSYFSAASNHHLQQQQQEQQQGEQLGAQRGGQLTTSLLDIGVLPSSGGSGSLHHHHQQQQRQGGGSYRGSSSGSSYSSSSGYEASGSGSGSYDATGRRVLSSTYGGAQEMVAPASSQGSGAAWGSYSSYSSPSSRASSSYGSSSYGGVKGAYREQRTSQQQQGGADCDGNVAV